MVRDSSIPLIYLATSADKVDHAGVNNFNLAKSGIRSSYVVHVTNIVGQNVIMSCGYHKLTTRVQNLRLLLCIVNLHIYNLLIIVKI